MAGALLLLICFPLQFAEGSPWNLTRNYMSRSTRNSTKSDMPDVRIVGGMTTTIERFPFMVDVHLDNEHHCGGTLLTPDTVLTASHCVHDSDVYNSHKRYALFSPHQFRVVLGSTFSKLNRGQPTVRYVSDIHAHPRFMYSSFENDIALLKLSEPVKLSRTIQLVDILSEDPPPDTVCTAIGWGMTKPIGAKETARKGYVNVLHVVDLPIISLSECQAWMPSVTDQHLCTYTESKDACVGDSGGPLMCLGKQAGIISYGVGCAVPYKPGVYQKIYIHSEWQPLKRTGRATGRGKAEPVSRPRARRSLLPAFVVALAALPLPLPL